MSTLTAFFHTLYQSDQVSNRGHSLSRPLNITAGEVAAALAHMSRRKALLRSQMPAVLWKMASQVLIPSLCESFNKVLGVGPLEFPEAWRKAFLVLLPKPGRPPSKPENLRPIAVLPAEPKLLARIAAERLKPLLLEALYT